MLPNTLECKMWVFFLGKKGLQLLHIHLVHWEGSKQQMIYNRKRDFPKELKGYLVINYIYIYIYLYISIYIFLKLRLGDINCCQMIYYLCIKK